MVDLMVVKKISKICYKFVPYLGEITLL